MKSFRLLIIFFTTCFQVYGQKSFFESGNAYLGQRPPTDTPRIFVPLNLIPDSGFALDRSAFSVNGKEFYYCTADHWFDSRGVKVRYFNLT